MSKSFDNTCKHNAGVSDTENKQSTNIVVSLGKPSLRMRLEAYYSLIAPDLVANETEWRSRFEQIWAKYGGTHEGESKLAAKLSSKYGSTVRLLLASTVESKKSREEEQNKIVEVAKRIEGWYELTADERGSGIVDFTSNKFDPVAALLQDNINSDKVLKTNPWVMQSKTMLDRVDQFRNYLPQDDPLYRPFSNTLSRNNKLNKSETEPNVKIKAPSCFASIASLHQNGPFSVLYNAFINRQRIRVVIRYVNCIRGTLTGYLVAFDKHMNLILRDAEENYSPRFVGNNDNTTDAFNESTDVTAAISTNKEIELQRRISGISGKSFPPSDPQSFLTNHEACVVESRNAWTHRQRHLPQVLVRGDSVVLVYKADQERSAWPVTSKSPKKSIYRCRSIKRDLPPEHRVGTPGSLIYAAQRHQTQFNRRGKSAYRSV